MSPLWLASGGHTKKTFYGLHPHVVKKQFFPQLVLSTGTQAGKNAAIFLCGFKTVAVGLILPSWMEAEVAFTSCVRVTLPWLEKEFFVLVHYQYSSMGN